MGIVPTYRDPRRQVFRRWAACGNICTKPCIHAGFENPVVAYNATFGGVKSMEKGRFPQFFCCFCWFFSVFSGF
jgi:hypothetical protein